MRTVEFHAHRELRRRRFPGGQTAGASERYHDACDERDLVRRYPVSEARLVGIYQNDEGVEPGVIVITNLGLRFPQEPGSDPIDYADIADVDGPHDKLTGPRDLVITLNDGSLRAIAISGRHGPNEASQDVYTVWNFLRPVVFERPWLWDGAGTIPNRTVTMAQRARRWVPNRRRA